MRRQDITKEMARCATTSSVAPTGWNAPARTTVSATTFSAMAFTTPRRVDAHLERTAQCAQLQL